MTLVLEHEVVPGLVAFADPEVMHAANVVDDGRGYREIRAFEGCNKNPYRLLTRSPEAAT